MILASLLMHLSEVKHGWCGIYPFNKYSNEFLWCDEMMVIGCVSCVFYKLISSCNETSNNIFEIRFSFRYDKTSNNIFDIHWRFEYDKIINKKFLWKVICGFSCLLISENVKCIGQIGFAITHSAWHLLAYELMYDLLK